MKLSRRVSASPLLKLLVGLLAALLLVVPAGGVASSGKAPSDQATFSYDSPFAATTASPSLRTVAPPASSGPRIGEWAPTISLRPAAKGVEADLPGLLSTAPKPLGLGSTGRTVPGSIREQMAMASVRNNPAGASISRIKMSDPRWPAADGWVKMQQVEGGVTIHYVRNTVTGAVDDFKFVSP